MPATEKLVPTIEALLTSRISALEKRIEALENAFARQTAAVEEAQRIGELPRAQPFLSAEDLNGDQWDPGRENSAAGPPVPGGWNGNANGRFEIVSVDSRTFERDQEEKSCKFSWKIVVRNLTNDPISLNAQLEFVDMDSYLVEEDSADHFKLDPGETGKFRGYKWISTEAERQICGVRAHLTEAGTEPQPAEEE